MAIAVILGCMLLFVPKGKEKGIVVVKVDGKTVWEGEFPQKTETMRFESAYGWNVLELGKDYARVVNASCPYRWDVKRGKISRRGEAIICVPNRFLVEIKEPYDVDGMVR